MTTDKTAANEVAHRHLAEVRAGRPYSWSLDRYGSGRTTFTLSLGAEGAFVLEERDQDLGGTESTYRSSIDEAEALRRLVLGC